MCREIKFRAWDILKQRMCEVKNIVFLENGDMLIQASEKGISEPLLNQKNEGGVCNNEFELMQFTGLYDAHFEEIYEGDVVNYTIFAKNKYQEIPCVVYFDMAAYYLKDIRLHGRFDLLSEVEADDIVAIGNLYENPWLLSEDE